MMIENLVTALETEEITLSLDGAVLLNELEHYERDVTDPGSVTYGEPEGLHDDAVDALTLGYRVLENPSSTTRGWMVTHVVGSLDDVADCSSGGRDGAGRRLGRREPWG